LIPIACQRPAFLGCAKTPPATTRPKTRTSPTSTAAEPSAPRAKTDRPVTAMMTAARNTAAVASAPVAATSSKTRVSPTSTVVAPTALRVLHPRPVPGTLIAFPTCASRATARSLRVVAPPPSDGFARARTGRNDCRVLHAVRRAYRGPHGSRSPQDGLGVGRTIADPRRDFALTDHYTRDSGGFQTNHAKSVPAFGLFLLVVASAFVLSTEVRKTMSDAGFTVLTVGPPAPKKVN
jgi:hypothetical protein